MNQMCVSSFSYPAQLFIHPALFCSSACPLVNHSSFQGIGLFSFISLRLTHPLSCVLFFFLTIFLLTTAGISKYCQTRGHNTETQQRTRCPINETIRIRPHQSHFTSLRTCSFFRAAVHDQVSRKTRAMAAPRPI